MTPPRLSLVVHALACVSWTSAALSMPGPTAVPQTRTGAERRTISAVPRLDFPEAHGVKALVLDSDRLLVGGTFAKIGHVCGALVHIDDATCAVIPSAARFLGSVSVAVSDGDGGAFVGGDFTADGNLDGHLAHVRNDGTVVPVSSDDLNGPPMALAFDVPSGTLYVTGGFVDVGGHPRGRAAAFDVATGALLPWTPPLEVKPLTQPPIALAVVGGHVWIGGKDLFQGSNLVVCDAVTGAMVSHDFGFDDTVRDIVEAGGRVFVGGEFTHVKQKPREHLAAFSAQSLALDAFHVPFDGDVRCLTVEGRELFVGGWFSMVAGAVRIRVASLDLQTDSLTSWSAQFSYPGYASGVNSILVTPAGVFVGGNYTLVNGEKQVDLVLLDRASGALLAGGHHFEGTQEEEVEVRALVQCAGQVLACGNMYWADEADQRKLAAIDVPSGTVDPSWHPLPPKGPVRAIALNSSTCYVGGTFQSVGTISRRNLAAYDRASGVFLDSFDPDWSGAVSKAVEAIAACDGAFFVAANHPSAPTYSLLALDPATGQQLGSFPQLSGTGQVLALTLSPDQRTLYVGGVFDTFGSLAEPRDCLAALDTTTGALLPWHPRGCAEVRGMRVHASRLYVVGYVDAPLLGLRDYSMAYDLASGELSPWAPPLEDVTSLDGLVALVPAPGLMLIAGHFYGFGGVPAYTAAAVDLGRGQTAVWLPEFVGKVGSFAAHREAVVVGGNLEGVGSIPRIGLAAFAYE